MNLTEQLPQDHYWYTLPKWMVPDCGYACGKMSINGVSTMSGLASLWLCMAIGRRDSAMIYRLHLYAKQKAMRWMLESETERQQSVHNFRSRQSGNWSATQQFSCVLTVLVTFICQKQCYTLPACAWKSAPMERQQFLALYHGYSKRDVAVFGYIQSCARLYWLIHLGSLSRSVENALNCGFTGGCRGNFAWYLLIKAAYSR